jgi:hypothetical protein
MGDSESGIRIGIVIGDYDPDPNTIPMPKKHDFAHP